MLARLKPDTTGDGTMMPRIADLSAIRTILELDRPWAVYALGDLSPGFAEHCEWFAFPDEPPALLLLYRRFDPPVLFAQGPADRVARLMQEIEAPALSLHVRTEALAAILPPYRSPELRPMWRMLVEPETFRPAAAGEAALLSGADIDAIKGLYADGHQAGEGPDFFDPSMVEQGMFRGVWEGDELVAVAGTHLVEPTFGVCAIGNVYTRRDRRRRGLASRVTSAVVSDALLRNLPTVALNVDQRNAAARRVYERLGFKRHCDFVEGLALRA
jgi:ribosomal protein S18 acetylase RimI-like enzyme